MRLARNENHKKAHEYAAALDEVKTRSDFVDDQQLQRLFLRLLADSVQARVAKDANAILKRVGKVPPSPMPVVLVVQCVARPPTMAVPRFSASVA